MIQMLVWRLQDRKHRAKERWADRIARNLPREIRRHVIAQAATKALEVREVRERGKTSGVLRKRPVYVSPDDLRYSEIWGEA